MYNKQQNYVIFLQKV